MTLHLTNEEIEGLLPIEGYIEALEQAFVDFAEGRATNRPRSHTYTPLGEGRYYLFKSMDGALPRFGVHALRLSSDICEEREAGGRLRREKLPALPGNRYLGLVLLFRIENGELLAILQDGVLQRMRVGATSGLAAKYLARPGARVAGLFGTGWQAGSQVMAHAAVHPLERIKVYSPRRENRERFCREYGERVGIELQPVDDPRRVVEGSDIVICATNSLDPVFDGDWLVPGQHVNSVQGGEIDARTLERADLVAVRSRVPATHHARGGWRPKEGSREERFAHLDLEGKLVELGDVIRGLVRRSSPEQITFFGGGGIGASSGLGIQFAAVAAKIYERAREAGVGREIPTDWFLESVHP